ncbi:MAG: hypothetical protein AAFP23_06625, partial [Pseudomonadota bacterium]
MKRTVGLGVTMGGAAEAAPLPEHEAAAMLGIPGAEADAQAAPSSWHERTAVMEQQREALWREQRDDGHIVFELEADCTIPAEYVLLRHFLGEIDPAREARIALYIRSVQNEDGSWPLFHDGAGNISATVKGYWALKLIGDDIDAPHMVKARNWVLAQGGAATANVFTRIMLALYREIPWRGMPCIPVEAILMPEWFPFHMSKIAYWSRTVLTPLLILYAKRA